MPGRAVFTALVIVMTLLTSGSAVTAGSESAAAAEPPLYGLYSGPAREREPLLLTRLHPRTLGPVGARRVALARRMTFAGRSPDGRFAGFYERQPARLRVIDLETMRVRGDLLLRVGKRWRIREAAWLTADRIVFVVQLLRGSYEQIVQTRQIVVVDPLALRVVARQPFANAMALTAAEQGGGRLVLLLGRGDQRDNKRLLAVVSSDGVLRTTSLTLEGISPSFPSLVVDPSGGRAFVVAAGSPVLDVDLETLQVARRPVSGAGRLFEASRYSSRRALLVDERTLAVFGSNHVIRPEGETMTPAGLALVDTTTWQARLIEPQATGATYSAGTLVAYGWRFESTGGRGKPRRQRATGIGLRAFEPNGAPLWRRFAGQPLSAHATRDVALVFRIPTAGPGATFPVDLATGRQVGPVRSPEINIWPLPDAAAPTRAVSATANERQAIELDGDGEAVTGTAREDVTRVVAVLVDGSEQELALESGRFAFNADSPERSTRLVRAYVGDTLVATVTIDVRCGGIAGPCAGPAPGAEERTYAFVGELPTGDARLVQVDPRTLTPIGAGLELNAPLVTSHARSPDGRRLAIGTSDRAQLRIIDLDRLTTIRTIELAASPRTSARAIAWLADDRLVAVIQRASPTGRYVRERTAIVADPSTGTIVGRQRLTNKLALAGSVHAAGRLVLMLRSSSHRGSTVQLVVVDADGTVRTRVVDVGKRAGVLHTTQLAVAPNGRRAFLLGWAIRRDTPPVLEIDLDTLAVRARTLRVDGAALPRAGISTLQVGAIDDRYLVAVGAVAASEKADGEFVPAAGIFRVDTQSWTAGQIDPRATYFRVRDGNLLTYGPSSRLRELARPSGRGSGVTAYALPGRRLYHLYGDRPFSQIELAGAYGHVLLGPSRAKRLVFDADSGKPLGMLPALEGPIEVLGAPPPPPPPGRSPQAAPPGSSSSTTRASQAARPDDPFARVSNRGTRVPAKADRPGEREMTPRDLFLLRRDEGRAVYRIGGLRQGTTACYATGSAADVGRLGTMACGRSGFPSRARPLFDLSSSGMRRGEKQAHLLRLTGVAADAIAEIGLIDAGGSVVVRVPVEANVYLLASPPPEATGSLVAYDRNGRIVHRTAQRREIPARATSPRRLAGYRIKLTLPEGWTGEIRRSPGGRARALVLASNGLPARDRRSVWLALSERDPRSEPRFPPVAAPPRLVPADVRATGSGRLGRFERSFTLRGRQFELDVVFGSSRPPLAPLAQVNRLLATLQVGAIAVPPKPGAAGAAIQRGRADGVAVDVHRSGIVVFRFDLASALYRALGKRVSIACLTFDSVNPWESNEWWASKPVAPTVQFIVSEATRPRPPYETLDPATEAKPPFDGCLVSGSYGRHWNDPRGQHSPAEIAFTANGRRFFDERAVARDLALFVRSPHVAPVRRSMKQGAAAPAAAAIARRHPRLVALSERNARVAHGRIGIWSDGAAVLEISARTREGKRLFVELRGGRIGRHNLDGLAFVF
jgi:hypothetical protein